MRHTYQLTHHPVGSKREFWALSWPLMLGLVSTTLMIFIDRLFLSRYSPIALNAAAYGGMAYYMFLVIPMGISSISEVLVGRLHGEGEFKEIGRATWQMIWFSLFLTPFFLLLAWFAPPLLFYGTTYPIEEGIFFETLMPFGPIQCIAIAISGFFIGIGNVKIVTYGAIIANIVNISLDYVLIFGLGDIPSMGIFGAAIATGISQIFQCLFLIYFFWKKKNRIKFYTTSISLNFQYLLDGLKIGVPSGFGRFIEVLSHFLFFRLVMLIGVEQLTILTLVQSLYILTSFVADAAGKSASAIISNLLGAKVHGPIKKVLYASFSLHTFYFLIFFSSVIFFSDQILHLFISPEHKEFFTDPRMREVFFYSLLNMSIFFLLDGFGWILAGFLTASGDTRFIFWVSLAISLFAFLLPGYWLIAIYKGGADIAWGIIAAVGFISFSVYYSRYKSGAWLKNYKPL